MRIWILAAMPLSACTSLALEPPTLSGQWGGPHIGLVMSGAIGQIDYDCASGTIDEIVIPARDGRFTARGTHRAGQGGPVRVGQIFASQRATYAGKVVKDDMTLTATLDDGTVLGPFALKRGAQPQIVRCL